jgi:hypothetical protein
MHIYIWYFFHYKKAKQIYWNSNSYEIMEILCYIKLLDFETFLLPSNGIGGFF